MARVGHPEVHTRRHHGVPDGEVFPIPIEIGASVEYAEENQWQALQETAEELEVRSLCMTKRSGPRSVWLLGRKSWLTITFGLESNQKGQLPLTLCLKELSVWWGGWAESIIVIASYRRQWEGKEGRERVLESSWVVWGWSWAPAASLSGT
jgi:hypothetical protein